MEEVIIKRITFTSNYNQIQLFYMQMTRLVHDLFYNPLPQHERAVQAIIIQQLMTWYDNHDSQISEDVQVELRLPIYET